MPEFRFKAKRAFSLRGPSHGLQGTPSSQRRSTTGKQTVSFRHSALLKLQKQGNAAYTAKQMEDVPDIVVSEDFAAPGFDMPVNEHNLPEDHFLGASSDDSDWEEEDRADEGLVRTKDRMMKSMKRQYKDFRSRRDRTEKTWLNFAPQMDELIVAYMDWDYAQRKSLGHHRQAMEEAELYVYDIFGVFSLLFRLLLILIALRFL